MKGEIGDTAMFVDRDGNEYKAIITDTTASGNASLSYSESEDGAFSAESLHLAFNIPNEEDAMTEPYYKHRPNASWPEEVL